MNSWCFSKLQMFSVNLVKICKKRKNNWLRIIDVWNKLLQIYSMFANVCQKSPKTFANLNQILKFILQIYIKYSIKI